MSLLAEHHKLGLTANADWGWMHRDLLRNAPKCHFLTELEFRKCHGSESRVINRTHVQQEKEEKIPHRAAPFVCLENYPVVIRGHPVI